MASMKQLHANITNIPDLKTLTAEHRRQMLKQAQKKGKKHIMLLPALYREFLPQDNGDAPAMDHILTELSQADYIDDVILGLDQATQAEYQDVIQRMSALPQKVHILWNDGPRLQQNHLNLNTQGLAPKERGKGYNVWYCLGYIQGLMKQENIEPENVIIGMHDCDIITYSQDMAAKLFIPMSINQNFDYAKGHYPRHDGDKLNGRVTRLFVGPIIKSLLQAFDDTPVAKSYLSFLDGFQYPLSGEMAFRGSVLKDLNMPFDWGLEIGLLSDAYHKDLKICDIAIADVYDHKHQDVSADNPKGGLHRMVQEISKALFRHLAQQGVTISKEKIEQVIETYKENASSIVFQFAAAAQANGLNSDMTLEQNNTELFAQAIHGAYEAFVKEPKNITNIPQWHSVLGQAPDTANKMLHAVQQDKNDYEKTEEVKQSKSRLKNVLK